MSDKTIDSWFPALIYTVDKKDKYSILKLITKIFVANLLSASIATITLWLMFGTGEEAAFFKESEMGSSAALYNLVTFLIIVLATSIIIYLLIKLRKFNVLELIGVLLFAFVSGSISSIIIPLIFYLALLTLNSLIVNINGLLYFIAYSFDLISLVIFVLFFVLQILVSLHEKFKILRNTLLLIIASWSGVFIGLYTGLLTPIVLMIGFSLYDIYAVKQGPIKKITSELRDIQPRSTENARESNFVLGLGDLFFYSVALSYSLAYFNLIVYLEVTIALIIGILITIWILLSNHQEERELPALPIPLMLALLIIFLNSII